MDRIRIFDVIVTLALAALAGNAFGAVNVSTDLLPPSGTEYAGAQGDAQPMTFDVNGVENAFVAQNLRLWLFSDSVAPPEPGSSVDSDFYFVGTTDTSAFGAPYGQMQAPGHAVLRITAPGTRTGDGSVRNFGIELLSLDLGGGNLPAGVLLRESPTLASIGQLSISRATRGAGFTIDSFFDIFTELSVDGGLTYIPSNGSTRMTLGVPTPGAVSFAFCGIGAMAIRRRRA